MTVLHIHKELGMHSSEQRYIWATYLVLLALSSLIGDAVILVVSGNRKNFRLNKFLVTIMQHIAVSDISVSIVMILPTAISLLADAWVLGGALCYAVPYLCAYFYLANMSLICALVAGKLLLLRKPLRARNWSKKHAHLICGMIWMFFIVNPILMYTLGKDDVSFDYRTYICFYGFKSYTWKKIQPFVSFASFIFPNTMIITTTIPTLKYLIEARKSANRTKKSLSWQGSVTISLAAIVYCLTTLPVGVYFLGHSFLGQENHGFHYLLRFGVFLAMANISSNFFIYSLTITSFRRYLLSKIERTLKWKQKKR